MDLLLWRHAEAEDPRRGLADIKRHLTERGEKQARQVARWLRGHLPKDARILVSPAMRTQQTVLPLELPYETEERIGPGADVAALLGAAGWPNIGGTIMLVGHQPALGRFASLLLCGAESELTIRKGALWWISRRDKDGGEKVFLRAVITPELL